MGVVVRLSVRVAVPAPLRYDEVQCDLDTCWRQVQCAVGAYPRDQVAGQSLQGNSTELELEGQELHLNNGGCARIQCKV